MINRNFKIGNYITIAICLMLIGLITTSVAIAQTAGKKGTQKNATEVETEEKDKLKKAPPAGPLDEFERGNPRSSVKGFFKAARDGDFERAAKYLDLRNLPRWMNEYEGSDLARQFKISLDRSLWVDLDLISTKPDGNLDDGLPAYREIIGQVKMQNRTIDILLQKVPRKDGIFI